MNPLFPILKGLRKVENVQNISTEQAILDTTLMLSRSSHQHNGHTLNPHVPAPTHMTTRSSVRKKSTSERYLGIERVWLLGNPPVTVFLPRKLRVPEILFSPVTQTLHGGAKANTFKRAPGIGWTHDKYLDIMLLYYRSLYEARIRKVRRTMLRNLAENDDLLCHLFEYILSRHRNYRSLAAPIHRLVRNRQRVEVHLKGTFRSCLRSHLGIPGIDLMGSS
ncbi:hypothetical protein C8R44DRAFT_854159 [Mycena epipterygia]|nr:hypothetical protein C8R44DRAFT_854159 [Mycena epipterygia]